MSSSQRLEFAAGHSVTDSESLTRFAPPGDGRSQLSSCWEASPSVPPTFHVQTAGSTFQLSPVTSGGRGVGSDEACSVKVLVDGNGTVSGGVYAQISVTTSVDASGYEMFHGRTPLSFWAVLSGCCSGRLLVAVALGLAATERPAPRGGCWSALSGGQEAEGR